MKNPFGAGLFTGAVIGTVAGMLIDPLKDKQSKKIHCSAENMFRSIGSIIDGMISR